MTLDDLTVSFGSVSQESVLSDWVWLVGDQKLPILLTSSGDAFLQDPDDGSVHFLDTGAAHLEKVADSIEEFQNLLNDKAFVVNYMAVEMVGDLIQAGQVLEKEQIYSLIKPLVLGGEYTHENLEVADIEVHFSTLGQIHRKVKDLPDGASVNLVDFK